MELNTLFSPKRVAQCPFLQNRKLCKCTVWFWYNRNIIVCTYTYFYNIWYYICLDTHILLKTSKSNCLDIKLLGIWPINKIIAICSINIKHVVFLLIFTHSPHARTHRYTLKFHLHLWGTTDCQLPLFSTAYQGKCTVCSLYLSVRHTPSLIYAQCRRVCMRKVRCIIFAMTFFTNYKRTLIIAEMMSNKEQEILTWTLYFQLIPVEKTKKTMLILIAVVLLFQNEYGCNM